MKRAGGGEKQKNSRKEKYLQNSTKKFQHKAEGRRKTIVKAEHFVTPGFFQCSFIAIKLPKKSIFN
jgi:hypothetical protein